MANAGKTVRTIGHPTVAALAKVGYDSIAERDDLTPGEQIGAAIGTAVLQILGHIAVEAVADWADSD